VTRLQPLAATRQLLRTRFGSISVDVLTLQNAVRAMVQLVREGRGGTVFTPNVDHVVRAERDPQFRDAYQRASLSIVDGMPLVWASRLLGKKLPERISGSDWLEPLLCACARDGHSVYFLGGREGAGKEAKERLQTKYPSLVIAGVGPRTRDIEADGRLLDAARDEIVRLRPAFAVVALGSPLQEVWSAQVSEAVAPTVLLNLGSALDLAAGMIPRAPRWMADAGLEWLYRLAREPRRLWRRYLVRGPQFLVIVLRQLRKQRPSNRR
jgi:N-acetylglucosaminyldiphosphoundecaprenol N-acetyl-beta-D-mannosaminyltransferase